LASNDEELMEWYKEGMKRFYLCLNNI